jgi:hypothetical protein
LISLYKMTTKPSIPGVILILSCQKHIDTRLKEFRLPKTEYLGWKVIYVIGDLFMESECEMRDDVMWIKCEDSYLHLTKKLALSLKHCFQLWDIQQGILRCGDDLIFNEVNLLRFLTSQKQDFLGQSDAKGNVAIRNKMVLKNVVKDNFMVDYYKKHDEDFANPQHNLMGVNVSDYTLRPRLVGVHGVIYFMSNKACRCVIEVMESIDYNIFHKDSFTNSYPYIIEDCAVSYILLLNGFVLVNSRLFFNSPNSIAIHTNKYK